jgi:hypothetical protein
MNAISSHINSRRTAIGIPMIRGAVMAGVFARTILTALPPVTFARDNNGDNNGKHSLVQQPYGLKTKSPFASTFQTIDTLQASRDALTADMAALKAQVDQLTTDNTKLRQDLTATTIALNAAKADISTVSSKVVTLETKAADIIPGLATYLKVDKTTVLQGVNGPHILITGANVHVRSGSEATDNNAAPYTGLGNLIIGYNENTILLHSRTNRFAQLSWREHAFLQLIWWHGIRLSEHDQRTICQRSRWERKFGTRS